MSHGRCDERTAGKIVLPRLGHRALVAQVLGVHVFEISEVRGVHCCSGYIRVPSHVSNRNATSPTARWLQLESHPRFRKEPTMAKLARDVMTEDPACCSPETTLEQVAKMMLDNDCGEIPILDRGDRPIGVVTDRDIVCRVVAEGKNPMGYTVDTCMTTPVRTVSLETPIEG